MTIKLSKTKFVAGCQCLKRLYLQVHQPTLAAETDEAAEATETALAAIRELRKTFAEPSDLEWRAKEAEVFKQNGLAAQQLLSELESRLVTEHLQQIR